MAKSGGKAAKGRGEQRTGKQKEQAAAPKKTGKAAGPKRPKGAQFVEQVAAQIVMAEFDRAVSEARQGASVSRALRDDGPKSAEPGPPSPASAEAIPARTVAREATAKAPFDAVNGSPSLGKRAGASFSELLRAPAGAADPAAMDPAATPGAPSREKAEAQLPRLAARLEELQERLYAAATGGRSKRRLVLVLQGMDTSGKGGTVRHVVGLLNPTGIRLTSFKAPTEQEREHDVLWRVRNAVPLAGEIGIFDRSHYEDVLIARVRKLAPPMVIGKRYQLINRFEQNLAADGVEVVKCFLHISPQKQKERLLARLDDPRKQWKYDPGDLAERALWPQYQEAYRLALAKCDTDAAPWYVVPADHKWYRNYAITRLLLEALERIDPAYPPSEYDVDVERKRLLESPDSF
jgi:PPK2 family polyphosphate:nucleotide phosphotransferase